MRKIFFLFTFTALFFILQYSCKKDAGPLPKAAVVCNPKGRVVIQVGGPNSENYFSPSQAEAKTGDTIVWRYQSGYHFVKSTSIPAGAAPFSKGPMSISSPDSLVYVVQIAGTYNYICDVHPGMTGTITVCQ